MIIRVFLYLCRIRLKITVNYTDIFNRNVLIRLQRIQRIQRIPILSWWMLRDERCENPGYFGIVESIPGRNDVLRGRQERFSNPPVALPFYYPRYTSVQCLALLTSPLTLTITAKCYDEIVLAIIDGMSRMYTSQETWTICEKMKKN